MNCIRFAGMLADYQEGALSVDERSAVEEHLENCSSCRQLQEVAVGSVDILPEEMRDGLTRSILDRTSGGSVCPGVESALWEFAGGQQTPEAAHLIALHLDHCAGCASMAADLASIQDVLPEMAEIDPGESFTRTVILATSGRRAHPPDGRTRFLGWWNRMVQRPRFALESAYVCTVMLLFFLSPFLPFRDIVLRTIPSKAIYPSAQNIVSIWTDTKIPVSLQASKLAYAAVSGNRAVSATLGGLAERCARVSSAALNKSIQIVGSWPRKEGADLAEFWNRLSRWIPRNKS
jgi:anti-sigma factor RsiW